MSTLKRALICGAGGFIGGHLVRRLKNEGYWIRAVDLKKSEYSIGASDEFILGDLRDPMFVDHIIDQPFDEIYQLAADMGGAEYLFTGQNDAEIMHNSVLINLNILRRAVKVSLGKIFFPSSACVYADFDLPDASMFSEESAYPALPGNEYGWEKLFSERLYFAYRRNYGLDVRVARFHNIFGPEGPWIGGKERAVAALCRKIAEIDEPDGVIRILGDGNQTRSFLYIDECLNAISRLVNSNFEGPVNIGSEDAQTINQLAQMLISIADKPRITIEHTFGPTGARSRLYNGNLIQKKLGWTPSSSLRFGLERTYEWVLEQVSRAKLIERTNR